MNSTAAPQVIDAVDQLEEMINIGRRIPLTPSVVLNEERALELLDRIRLQLPDELVEARGVLHESTRLIEEADSGAAAVLAQAAGRAEQMVTAATMEAENVRRVAHEHATALASSHSVARAAAEKAAATLASAQSEADHIRSEADEYARQVLERLGADLERATDSVRHGLEALPRATRSHRSRRSV